MKFRRVWRFINFRTLQRPPPKAQQSPRIARNPSTAPPLSAQLLSAPPLFAPPLCTLKILSSLKIVERESKSTREKTKEIQTNPTKWGSQIKKAIEPVSTQIGPPPSDLFAGCGLCRDCCWPAGSVGWTGWLHVWSKWWTLSIMRAQWSNQPTEPDSAWQCALACLSVSRAQLTEPWATPTVSTRPRLSRQLTHAPTSFILEND
jgi:hypothetical protein